jgi:hypothetical protein
MEMRGETERAKKAAEAAVLMFRNLETGPGEGAPAAKPAAQKPGARASKPSTARTAKKPARRA